MNALLMSSSSSATSGFLEAQAGELRDLLAGISRALFIPYAIVGEKRDERIEMVRKHFSGLGIALDNVEDAENRENAVNKAEAVLVSGGNTFHLLHGLYASGLVGALQRRVREGVPYAGWSAGSNVAGKTICTTNDMPIVYPPTFKALGLLPFQINPHYTDATPSGLRGETREQRIQEFLAVNPNEIVVGLPEGVALRVRGSKLALCGEYDAWLFRAWSQRQRLAAGRDLSHLL